jgi:hypothetical protein
VPAVRVEEQGVGSGKAHQETGYTRFRPKCPGAQEGVVFWKHGHLMHLVKPFRRVQAVRIRQFDRLGQDAYFVERTPIRKIVRKLDTVGTGQTVKCQAKAFTSVKGEGRKLRSGGKKPGGISRGVQGERGKADRSSAKQTTGLVHVL